MNSDSSGKNGGSGLLYIHLYLHKLQLQKQEIENNKGKRNTKSLKVISNITIRKAHRASY